MSLTTDKNGAVTLGKARHLVALEATWEIAVLCDALVRVELTDDDYAAKLLIRGLAARVQDLGSSIMYALDDNDCTTGKLSRSVRRTAGEGQV